MPLDKAFDYRLEGACESDRGPLAVVPFGKRTAVGVIVDVARESDVSPSDLKSVARVLRNVPRLASDDLRLLRFASESCQHPLGPAVMWALQLRLRKPPKETRPRAPRQRAPAVRQSGEPAAVHRPTPAQLDAIQAVCSKIDAFAAFLLLGVTGSGKTEVYLRLAEAVLERGAQVLMLVAEIALTPQLEATVQARFPDMRLVSLHSALNETERLTNWRAAQAGDARILLGTRLAVFTPLPHLGLIVVDEEHDASFKQTEGFCYSARDLAVTRAHQRGVPVVLGSATPSLETYYNAKSGRYALLDLPQRINARPPRIDCIPLERRHAAGGLAPQLIQAIEACLERKEQALVLSTAEAMRPSSPVDSAAGFRAATAVGATRPARAQASPPLPPLRA